MFLTSEAAKLGIERQRIFDRQPVAAILAWLDPEEAALQRMAAVEAAEFPVPVQGGRASSASCWEPSAAMRCKSGARKAAWRSGVTAACESTIDWNLPMRSCRRPRPIGIPSALKRSMAGRSSADPGASCLFYRLDRCRRNAAQLRGHLWLRRRDPRALWRLNRKGNFPRPPQSLDSMPHFRHKPLLKSGLIKSGHHRAR